MEKLEEKLLGLFEKAIEAAEKTGEFVIDIAPEILQEFYMWRLVSNILLIVLGLVILFASFKSYILLSTKEEQDNDDYKKRWGRYFKKDYGYDSDSGAFAAALAFRIFGSIVSMVLISIGAYWSLFIVIAPKVYLIEYFIK